MFFTEIGGSIKVNHTLCYIFKMLAAVNNIAMCSLKRQHRTGLAILY